VTDGGGGTFSGIWTPSGYAQAGFYVSNTSTPGKVYELSAEHHIRAEIVLDKVENWEFLAPQTEEEVRDGMDCGLAGDPQFAQCAVRELPRLSRHALDQAGAGRGQDDQLQRHPLPQRARQRRERLCRPATTMAAIPICAPASSRSRTPSAT
jgi:hypothetical protein